MKKQLLFLLFVIAVSATNAQAPEAKVKFERETINQKDVYGGWYNFGEMMYDNLGNSDYFRNHLFPDSSVQVEFNNGFGHVWKHSMGQVFDPSDENWAIGGILPIDANDPYTVDSIRIWYRYFRHQTVNPDTLRVQVFAESDMSLFSDPWASGESYATTEYDPVTHLGVNPVQDYTILLDDSYIATTDQNFIPIEINRSVNAGEIIGVNVTYFPGNSYTLGDTIDQYLTVPPVNQKNAFISYNFRDNDSQQSTDFFNHGWLVQSSIRYDENPQGWNGNYYPTIAYFDYIDHTDIDFHVVGTVGIEEADSELFSIYPNPAQETLHLQFEGETIPERILITDITGKDVTSGTLFDGTSVNVSTLAEGNYMLTATIHGQTSTKRFVVKH